LARDPRICDHKCCLGPLGPLKYIFLKPMEGLVFGRMGGVV